MSLKTPKTCTDCGLVSCNKIDEEYPEFCLTTNLNQEELEEVIDLYSNDEETHKIAIVSAKIEGAFYGRYTRVEEIMEFARQINAKKIGIATCVGLINESRIFARILKKNGFEVYGVGCKVGAIDKTKIGIDSEYIRKKAEHICNPIMQAKILNKNETDLNVVVGLCVGHDSLFYKYATGITTTLITKDRVTGHNPAAAIYTSNSYYNKLL
ncbi:hypothetical protein DUF1847 [Gottschalkia acidurici 9a]|uniref:Metal-binding protein n=1 Tax=Gottschalkia acidurici (strain ATCC 7906 / DSM 604 / BCRC 14475 / CIP 104303 / KCTC 5404 / NCIMB 10678 / 9a) TaxID=1128398 RepID=K0B3T6_GOTA9|nr:DUF1847 domain-containing protein [Gottschalkia acidurici]AFS79560.1 hypothetical protein DUF1847 [Gottschalkia acidurici 9a]